MRYEIAETTDILITAWEMWNDACIEKEFKKEPFNPNGQILVFYNENNELFGMAELCPYEPNKISFQERSFKFSELDILEGKFNKTFEIDKLFIKEEYRRCGYIEFIFTSICTYSMENNFEYAIAILDSLFKRIIKIQFGINFEFIGKPSKEGKSKVYPVIIDMNKAISHLFQFDWFRNNLDLIQSNQNEQYLKTKVKQK